MISNNYKVIFCDVDETLISWTVDKEDCLNTTDERGKQVKVTPLHKNINVVKKLHSMGYDVVVWSRTGPQWAERIRQLVGLEDFTIGSIGKPMYYLDDKDCTDWMGERIHEYEDSTRS